MLFINWLLFFGTHIIALVYRAVATSPASPVWPDHFLQSQKLEPQSDRCPCIYSVLSNKNTKLKFTMLFKMLFTLKCKRVAIDHVS